MRYLEIMKGTVNTIFCNGKYIAFAKNDKVLICDKVKRELLFEIKIRNCRFACFYKEQIVLKNTFNVYIYSLKTGDKLFSFKAGNEDGYNLMLDNEYIYTGTYGNLNYCLNLNDFSLQKFSLKEGGCFLLEKFEDGYIAAINEHVLNDNVSIVKYDKNFSIKKKLLTISKISSITCKIHDDKLFFCDNTILKRINLKNLECEEIVLDFSPLFAQISEKYYLISNGLNSLIYTHDLEKIAGVEAENILDVHQIALAEDKVFISKKNKTFLFDIVS